MQVSEKQFLENILQNRGIILKICRIYRRDQDDQDDLYQEIILNAWRSYPHFEGRSKFSTWLYRVALNTALSETRKDKFFGLFDSIEHGQHVVDIEIEDNEKQQMLYRAIDQLDPMEKTIVILYLEDLPYSEISEISGLTESNVGVRLHRLKEKIKKMFAKWEK